MQDPQPSNIAGRKVRTHSFEHTIRWDYLVAALVAAYVIWKVVQAFSATSTDSEEEGVEIGVEDVQQAGQEVLTG
jgi:hypothetical protein